MKPYKHLLFDLDHTLWDFDANCKATLQELYTAYGLKDIGVGSRSVFYKEYMVVNNDLWGKYNNNLVTKQEMRQQRFNRVLARFGITDHALGIQLEDDYLERCPLKTTLVKGAIPLLDKVKPNFVLSIVTNGFDATQAIKVKASGLAPYFGRMFTSESTGYKKPDPLFFDHVLDQLDAQPEECLVIGDNPGSDIKGARNAGIDSLWVNVQGFKRSQRATYYADDLKEALLLF